MYLQYIAKESYIVLLFLNPFRVNQNLRREHTVLYLLSLITCLIEWIYHDMIQRSVHFREWRDKVVGDRWLEGSEWEKSTKMKALKIVNRFNC